MTLSSIYRFDDSDFRMYKLLYSILYFVKKAICVERITVHLYASNQHPLKSNPICYRVKRD